MDGPLRRHRRRRTHARRTGGPRPGALGPAGPPDPRRLAELAPRPGDVHERGPRRHLHAVPAPAAPGGRSRGLGRGAPARDPARGPRGHRKPGPVTGPPADPAARGRGGTRRGPVPQRAARARRRARSGPRARCGAGSQRRARDGRLGGAPGAPGRRRDGTWQLGEERYTRLLREKELLDTDARGLRERGRVEYDRLAGEMAELARRARGTDDWPAVLGEAARDHPATEEAMRQGYADWTARARSFLAERGLVTLPPGERCLVEPSPVFQRPVLGVASYNSPPAFSDSWTGHFFVPFAPDGTPEPEIQQRLEGNSWGDIPSVSVHETYPGHHWHLVMRKRNRSAVRRVFGTPYFTEGWALYAERMMRERGFFTDPIQELFQLKASLFRAARIVVDTSLHLGEMTFEEAVDFMGTKAGLPEPTARAEVGRYCTWPTQASAYLTGCLEILRIRRAWLDAHGFPDVAAEDVPVSSLREFHDTIAGSGALPLGLAERALRAT
ncbi:MAG TPA: DUF885 family protein [Candidatus Acidoferrales bacterium]|nr:DUF885 family protein [Candidatus Acidoferrales bacterium]